MKLHLHDNTPAAPGEKHGPDGPTHCANQTVHADYVYQIEMAVEMVFLDYPHVVYIRCPGLKRAWRRLGPKGFEEIPWLQIPEGVVLTTPPEP